MSEAKWSSRSSHIMALVVAMTVLLSMGLMTVEGTQMLVSAPPRRGMDYADPGSIVPRRQRNMTSVGVLSTLGSKPPEFPVKHILVKKNSRVSGDGNQRVVTIPDLHGDIDTCLELLIDRGIIDAIDHRWIAGTDIMIQLGDVLDRGHFGHEIIDFFSVLALQAEEAGGEVIQLMGNHELLALKGDTRFVSRRQVEVFGSLENYKFQFSPSGAYGKYLSRLPVAVVRQRVVYVHAGIVAVFAELGIEKLNARVWDAINRKAWNDAVLMDDGPLWTRRIVNDGKEGHCRHFKKVLRLLAPAKSSVEGDNAATVADIWGMVVGHTIQGSVTPLCDGTLFPLDVCMSRYMQCSGKRAYFISRERNFTDTLKWETIDHPNPRVNTRPNMKSRRVSVVGRAVTHVEHPEGIKITSCDRTIDVFPLITRDTLKCFSGEVVGRVAFLYTAIVFALAFKLSGGISPLLFCGCLTGAVAGRVISLWHRDQFRALISDILLWLSVIVLVCLVQNGKALRLLSAVWIHLRTLFGKKQNRAHVC